MDATHALNRYLSENNSEDGAAYKATYAAYQKNLTKHEVADYYDKWAKDGKYDMDLRPERYTGPKKTAVTMSKFFNENQRKTARILDVAAGTGMVGKWLYNQGFRVIDALDPAQGMLDKAKEHGVYRNFICSFIEGEGSVPIQDASYEGLCVSGGMGEGHIPVCAFEEMIRLVKPGGVVIITMLEEWIHQVDDYRDAMIPLMNKLEKEGKWTKEYKEQFKNYSFGKDGVTFVYRVN